MEKILVIFIYTGASFNQITWYNDNLNNHINVYFYYLSNETNQISVAVIVLELYKLKHPNQQKDKTTKTVNLLKIYIMLFFIHYSVLRIDSVPNINRNMYWLLFKQANKICRFSF